ncbi:MAG: Hsp20/alpha crystallin family protein [Thermoleophilia bacterium]
MNPRDKDEHSGIRRLQNEVDRMFLDLMGTNRLVGHARTAFRPNVDVYFSKSESAMIVRLELGGVDPQSLDLQVEERVLRIRGHRVDHGHKEKVYQQMEIAYGPFERRILLPVDVNAERAEANYHHGFLEVVLPIAEQSGSRRIDIANRDEEDDRAAGDEPSGSVTGIEGGGQ